MRSFANEKVATFSEPGELGRTLAEGVSRGEYPKGMVNFFSNVKHTTNRGVFQKFRGIFPLPVAWPNLGRAPGDACSSPEVEAWLALVCHSLNRLAGVKKSAPRFRQGAQVQRVVGCLRNRIGRFLSLFRPVLSPLVLVWEDVISKRISYDGEEFADPVPLSHEQIVKSLPPLGHGGSVELEPLLVGRARFLITHPEEILVGPGEREAGSNKAKVHIQTGEELKVWQLMQERGIVEWVNIKDVFADEGGPFLSGLFGVPKSGRFTESGLPLLRVIMNLKP